MLPTLIQLQANTLSLAQNHLASLIPGRHDLMDEVHNRLDEFCITKWARYPDSVFDPTQGNDRNKCPVCGEQYKETDRKKVGNHTRKHKEFSKISAHTDNRLKCGTCEKFKKKEMANGIELEWAVGKDSKPNHIQSCEREYAEKLTCPACLMSPIKWSK